MGIAANHGEDEIHLIPDPVFTLPTDGNTVTTIATTQSGRLFFGTKEGSLFEISYQVIYSCMNHTVLLVVYSQFDCRLIVGGLVNVVKS